MAYSLPQLEALRPALVACLVLLAACGVGDAEDPEGRPGGRDTVGAAAEAPESGVSPDPAVTATSPEVQARESGVSVLLQAVSPVSEQVVWISGHGGTWLRTEDGGRTWTSGVVPGADTLQFRDVHGLGADAAVLLSAGPGPLSRIFRTADAGATWQETFVMDHPDGFLDCLDFWPDGRGLAYGDAVEGALYLLRTEDGGRSWSRVPPDRLPAALEAEGGFAASGSCLRTGPEGRAWVATGNALRPRLLSTEDYGDSWSVTELPLASGEGSGATTVGFRPDGLGFALGGSLTTGDSGPRVALSADGGRSWSSVGDLVMDGAAYGAAWVPDRDPASLAAVGPGGIDWSNDGGMRWRSLDTLNHWAVAFSSPSVGWAVGPAGRLTRILLR